MQIEFTTSIWKEGDQFIAHAVPLDVASSGPTPEAARRAVDEAVQLFIRTGIEHGTLEEALGDAGYELDGQHWRSPAWVGVEQRTAEIAA